MNEQTVDAKTAKQPASIIPLIIILSGTTILALPATLGSLYIFGELLDHHTISATNNWAVLTAVVALLGYGLFAGYIYTIITRKHYRIFWAISLLYNLGLTNLAGYFIISGIGHSGSNFILLLLFPLWTAFVVIASGYYISRAGISKSRNLP